MSKPVLIALTGGGTAGHVMPHFAMLPHYLAKGWEVIYIGSKGIEKSLVANKEIRYFCIYSGKLRRYFSWQNFLDIFKLALGTVQALFILLKTRPRLVFSKGGYVSVPVALAAWVLRIPVLTHESDLTPGLANKIIERFAARILVSFPETMKHLKNPGKAILSGSPVREELFTGIRDKGFSFCGFHAADSLPIVLIMGGSSGSEVINRAVLECAEDLVKAYRLIHLTGKGKKIEFAHKNYCAFEFVGKELNDIYAITDLIVARAGANSIFEFLALNKPMLLIPLVAGSRGDQVDNAKSFVQHGWARMLDERKLAGKNLLQSIKEMETDKNSICQAQKQFKGNRAIEAVMEVLNREFNLENQ